MTTPQNTNPERATVAVTRCTDYQTDKITAAIEKQFTLLGGLEKFISRGDSVLLKPNLIVPLPADSAAQTDPAVLLAVARIVKDLGAKPFVADSPAWNNINACVKALGLREGLEKLAVPVKQLNKPTLRKIEGSYVAVSTIALEADKIINLPKFKTHQQLGATFAVKNMFGCVSGKQKPFWHFAKGKNHHDFCRMLIEIYKLLDPVLTIIDGVLAMEGPGPVNGNPRKLGFLIGGSDPIACEMVCCELVNFNPNDMPIIQTAKNIGFGCSDLSRINIAGDDYTDFICTDFQPAEQVPLRFSLTQICKSIAKQIILLIKSAFGGKAT